MTQPSSTTSLRKHPKGPNFLLIVILAGVAILVIFVASYFVVGSHGRHMLPKMHSNRHPHSSIVLPSRTVNA